MDEAGGVAEPARRHVRQRQSQVAAAALTYAGGVRQRLRRVHVRVSRVHHWDLGSLRSLRLVVPRLSSGLDLGQWGSLDLRDGRRLRQGVRLGHVAVLVGRVPDSDGVAVGGLQRVLAADGRTRLPGGHVTVVAGVVAEDVLLLRGDRRHQQADDELTGRGEVSSGDDGGSETGQRQWRVEGSGNMAGQLIGSNVKSTLTVVDGELKIPHT